MKIAVTKNDGTTATMNGEMGYAVCFSSDMDVADALVYDFNIDSYTYVDFIRDYTTQIIEMVNAICNEDGTYDKDLAALVLHTIGRTLIKYSEEDVNEVIRLY